VLSPASASFTPILVNSGGAAYTDSQGRLWSPDAGFSGGGTYATASPISGTADQTLYQDQRGGPMTYQFAVPNGSYRITLKFAELIQTTVGSRVFNVSLNGQTALQNFDVLAQTGGRFKAIDQQRPVTVTNGQIAIQFAAVVGNPMVSAIEIDLGFPPILVNSGGPAYADSLGRSWLADAGFSGGGVYTTTVSVSGTADPTLYQTQRGGTLTYQFNVPNGAYTVTLRFAELIQNAAGLRVFDVAINGQMALTNFDIFAQAGGNFKALDRQFPVTVAGSQITIQFTSVLGNPVLNALAIQ
jgi:hypothetical protein